MNSKPRVRSDLLHFMRNINPFSKKSFEAVIAQNLSDVKSFLKYFSESPEAQTKENVKAFFKIFFFGAELRNKVTNLKAELDASEYRTFVYLRTIKGAGTAEFIKTKREYNKLRAEVEEMGRIANEIEAAMYEAHLDEFVNTFFEKKFGEIGENDILVLEIEF
ncbi:MAG: hypothetical protein IJN05_08265 [Ruminococcus sp.]|nr:hypothetical protein [Ruminococcus sp.]